MFTIISIFQDLINGGLENVSKVTKGGGGTIIRYSRVSTFDLPFQIKDVTWL